MSLKFVVDTIPEGQESLYKEVDGQYVLDVEDAVPVSKYKEVETKANQLSEKIGEFRTSNIELRKQIEGKSGSDVNIDEIIDTATQPLKTNLQKKEEELAVIRGHLERVVLSDSVKDAAIKYGVLESAIPDVLNRARETFTVKDGVAVPKTKQVDKDGNQLNINTWITNLAESASHLFAKSSGAGAQKSVKGNVQYSDKSSLEKIGAGIAAYQK